MAHRGTKLFILHSSASFNFTQSQGCYWMSGLWQCLRVRPLVPMAQREVQRVANCEFDLFDWSAATKGSDVGFCKSDDVEDMVRVSSLPSLLVLFVSITPVLLSEARRFKAYPPSRRGNVALRPWTGAMYMCTVVNSREIRRDGKIIAKPMADASNPCGSWCRRFGPCSLCARNLQWTNRRGERGRMFMY
jgi:hypothetical protein